MKRTEWCNHSRRRLAAGGYVQFEFRRERKVYYKIATNRGKR